MSNTSRERAAEAIVTALSVGDRTAADRLNISDRTLRRHRARMATDPALAALVREKVKAEAGQWRAARLGFLRVALAKLKGLVEEAKVDQMRDVVGAIKIVGELQVATEALGTDPEARTPEAGTDGDPEAHRRGAAPAEDAGEEPETVQ